MNQLLRSNLQTKSWEEERKALLVLFCMEDIPELFIEIAVVRVCATLSY